MNQRDDAPLGEAVTAWLNRLAGEGYARPSGLEIIAFREGFKAQVSETQQTINGEGRQTATSGVSATESAAPLSSPPSSAACVEKPLNGTEAHPVYGRMWWDFGEKFQVGVECEKPPTDKHYLCYIPYKGADASKAIAAAETIIRALDERKSP